MYIFGYYMMAVGLGFFFIPQFTLRLIHFPPDDDPWIRFMGMLVAIIGVYYWYAARKRLFAFYFISIVGRYLVFAGALVLVIVYQMPSVLLLVAGNDVLFATLTLYFLRNEKQVSQSSKH